LVILSQTTRN